MFKICHEQKEVFSTYSFQVTSSSELLSTSLSITSGYEQIAY